MWKEREGDVEAKLELWEAAREEREPCSIRGAATMGTDPQHPPHHGNREGERERGVRGEATGIIT